MGESVAKGVMSVTTNCHDVMRLVLHHPAESGTVDVSWQIVLKKVVSDARLLIEFIKLFPGKPHRLVKTFVWASDIQRQWALRVFILFIYSNIWLEGNPLKSWHFCHFHNDNKIAFLWLKWLHETCGFRACSCLVTSIMLELPRNRYMYKRIGTLVDKSASWFPIQPTTSSLSLSLSLLNLKKMLA